ncbi:MULTISPECIES: ABC transporter substrate-binding protein [unclassified Cupriavidus]|jgi:branched-chain amino acid transport system substrate-binding protein|uniref:ABC transporter substrate-binding protein n=1 Tax=unclassified Cupriavidus TaxID=2640874 RepID=UPI001C00821A|nr:MULTISPECIES: ABC transporter substrate-binding protein [unclassified Cupriavidus]MCA3193496.1 ABC transporter substrate-binding protein [Cupriavidus sp.]MCA3199595.1 ABC transporter substrate-binding protein [Cupriavidus sp.]MCA3203373.1 ABC transporter substrate-binding protein [Cupriavidus sp.]MCA3206083.1 ABC transporter substrate-binding protein [Cupriavidus sp.]MCA3235822.1 ABC transporter substrate-binding protein [Cupriavidus sp.]
MRNARYFACGMLAVTLGFATPMAAHAEPGITKSAIRIGQSAGVSGPVAGSVKEQIAGAQVYLNHVNANGGVAGRRIELLTYDDGFDARRTPDNVRKLIGEDKVFALFMVRGTPQNESILPIIGAEKVPLVAPLTGAITLHRPVNRYVFNVRAKYQDEVARAINHLATSGMSRIAIFYANDGFGQDVFEGFNTALQARGVQPAGAASFNRPMGDIGQGVASINKANPQAVMVIGSGSEAARIIREMKKAGSQAQFVTLSNNAADSFIKELGDDGKGLIITQVVPGMNSSQMSIASEYRGLAKAQKLEPSNAGMEGFMSAKVLVEGLRRAGPEPTREKLVAALEGLRDYDLGGILISYSPTRHTGSSFVEMSIVSSTGKLIR